MPKENDVKKFTLVYPWIASPQGLFKIFYVQNFFSLQRRVRLCSWTQKNIETTVLRACGGTRFSAQFFFFFFFWWSQMIQCSWTTLTKCDISSSECWMQDICYCFTHQGSVLWVRACARIPLLVSNTLEQPSSKHGYGGRVFKVSCIHKWASSASLLGSTQIHPSNGHLVYTRISE